MNVIALFDKSFLQSLNENESVWFDHYFLTVISPIFFVETFADLAKEKLGSDRTAATDVRIIATKTPSKQGTPCVHHRTLAVSSLFGEHVPMNGQIPVPDARIVATEAGVGAFYGESAESKAFARWQREEFELVERQFASVWRRQLSELDLKALAAPFAKLGITPQTVKSLEEAKRIASNIVDNPGDPYSFMKVVFDFLGLPATEWEAALRRWSIYKFRPLKQHAPYLAYVLTVELFFRIAIAAKLIADSRNSNLTDIAYLFYLPFCQVMVSTDKLHRKCVPLFLRANQEFVWGGDLKEEMRRVNEHFSSLPEESRKAGLFVIAPKPVGSDDNLLLQLYDRHCPGWRTLISSASSNPSETDLSRRLSAQADAMEIAPPLPLRRYSESPEYLQSLVFKRSIRAKKGDWWLLPAEVVKNMKRAE